MNECDGMLGTRYSVKLQGLEFEQGKDEMRNAQIYLVQTAEYRWKC